MRALSSFLHSFESRVVAASLLVNDSAAKLTLCSLDAIEALVNGLVEAPLDRRSALRGALSHMCGWSFDVLLFSDASTTASLSTSSSASSASAVKRRLGVAELVSWSVLRSVLESMAQRADTNDGSLFAGVVPFEAIAPHLVAMLDAAGEHKTHLLVDMFCDAIATAAPRQNYVSPRASVAMSAQTLTLWQALKVTLAVNSRERCSPLEW